MSVLLVGLFLAVTFFGLNAVLRRRGNADQYQRGAVVVGAIIILIAWGIFAAIQLGFIANHYP